MSNTFCPSWKNVKGTVVNRFWYSKISSHFLYGTYLICIHFHFGKQSFKKDKDIEKDIYRNR